MVRDWLTELGINVPNSLAGFNGGLVHFFIFRRTSPFEAVTSVAVATLTANYLGQLASDYLHTPPLATAFIVGLCALQICISLVQAARTWKPTTASKPEP